ncbi:hypothetical protein IC608_13985 [Devosia sp. PTR5]|uniref:Uncharacterized protein n=1 Tax=Devosia oryzisoli TaxID=2774138 RepID=A0A927FV64_9HYPH|nr:hypothetical protein [Devosia oryzisoli]MBD8066581.1 hypothetical protein [Devosia oryzisoli]
MKTKIMVAALLVVAGSVPVAANGLGESRSYQFRSDSQRQVLLTVERTRLELLGLLGNGSSNGTGAGGTGQTGNTTSVNVSGSNNVITINQTNNGAQTQTRDCTGADFNITGGMYGC